MSSANQQEQPLLTEYSNVSLQQKLQSQQQQQQQQQEYQEQQQQQQQNFQHQEQQANIEPQNADAPQAGHYAILDYAAAAPQLNFYIGKKRMYLQLLYDGMRLFFLLVELYIELVDKLQFSGLSLNRIVYYMALVNCVWMLFFNFYIIFVDYGYFKQINEFVLEDIHANSQQMPQQLHPSLQYLCVPGDGNFQVGCEIMLKNWVKYFLSQSRLYVYTTFVHFAYLLVFYSLLLKLYIDVKYFEFETQKSFPVLLHIWFENFFLSICTPTFILAVAPVLIFLHTLYVVLRLLLLFTVCIPFIYSKKRQQSKTRDISLLSARIIKWSVFRLESTKSNRNVQKTPNNEQQLLQEEQEDEKDSSACVICLEIYSDDNDVVIFPCHIKHIYHMPCAFQWWSVHRSCPICKAVSHLHEEEFFLRDGEAPRSNCTLSLLHAKNSFCESFNKLCNQSPTVARLAFYACAFFFFQFINL